MKGTLSSSVNYCRKAGAVAWKKTKKTAVVAALGALAFYMVPAHAVDYFASAKTDVGDTFGNGSAAVYILYILEVLAVLFAYIKTKNLAIFGSIAAVLVFINIAFSLTP
ncbi:type IV conjugative transfer system pilin TraA [Mixta intestinalis]|uniref:Pilin n=1 Tax=Mixta intestinalis TaxID=1615494 RepID=A0A6P1Q6J2_9GAMM|nr:type IV conjugative transfer system pilin TraA [Mixta intestinalis]QHM74032.1 hypothetical protein C7M51_04393 [Mixta intestinalis]